MPRPSASAASSTKPPPLAANPASGIWPEVYYRVPPETREAYAYAVTDPPSLRSIACYCGCGGSGHQNNLDCYVDSFNVGGWITLDPHGFG